MLITFLSEEFAVYITVHIAPRMIKFLCKPNLLLHWVEYGI